MKVAQLLLPHAGHYDTKCHRADAGISDVIIVDSWSIENAGLVRSPDGETVTIAVLAARLKAGEYKLVHVYGSSGLPRELIGVLPAVWVASRPIEMRRSFFSRPAMPARILATEIPEPVDDGYFEDIDRNHLPREIRVVGSLARGPLVRRNWELAFARIQRVRGDVEWRLLDAPPSPRRLASFDLWVDPAEAEDDFDGFVSEAIAAGVPVVAARTEINRARTSSGRAGLLARRGDHNELAHAVLSGLFKDELTEPRRLAARDFRESFRVEARRRAVASVYRELAG